MVSRRGFRKGSINIAKSYERQEVAESHARPCTEGSWHIEDDLAGSLLRSLWISSV